MCDPGHEGAKGPPGPPEDKQAVIDFITASIGRIERKIKFHRDRNNMNRVRELRYDLHIANYVKAVLDYWIN